MENFRRYFGFQTKRYADLTDKNATWAPVDCNCLNRM